MDYFFKFWNIRTLAVIFSKFEILKFKMVAVIFLKFEILKFEI